MLNSTIRLKSERWMGTLLLHILQLHGCVNLTDDEVEAYAVANPDLT